MAAQVNRPHMSRTMAAMAFASGEPFRNGTAIFTDGDTVWSYGPHYVIAQYRDGGETIGVNEERYSVTTSGHVGAVRAALRKSGWVPSDETYVGPNNHTYRVWHVAP